ncbi:MAG: hypothetical protein DELT_00587 [Desulfovibrio sp.]
MQKSQRTTQDKMDCIRAKRISQRYTSPYFTPSECHKMQSLQQNARVRSGRTFKAFVVALINGEPLVSIVDKKALTHLGYCHGLLKLAALTFPFKLNIDPTLRELFSLMENLAYREAGRETSLAPTDGKRRQGQRGRRYSMYLDADTAARLVEISNGKPLASTIRRLVRDARITSRVTPEEAEYFRFAGLLLRASIDEESARQDGQRYGEADQSILVTINTLCAKAKEINRRRAQ